MGAYIVTGLRGKEHVTSADAGALNAGIFGNGRYVMNTAEQFAAEIVSNNIVRIKSGDLVNQGRHIRIEVNDYEDMTIENGAQSVKRNDLIVMRYKKDTSTTIELESAELVVIKGTAGATATDPTYTSGDILAGATQDDFPLYRVSLNGLNIEKVTPLFSTVPNLNELNTNMVKYKDYEYKAGAAWRQSAGGLYYYTESVDIPENSIVVAIYIIDFVNAKKQITIGMYDNKAMLMAESATPFTGGGYLRYRIAYI